MEKINVAVIGVGHLGKYHAKICAEDQNVNLIGVVDSNKENADKVAAEHNVKSFTDVSEVIDLIDSAHVVVPTEFHHVVTSKLLKAGKHVLLEKPMASTVEEADELLSLAKENDCILQVGHVERFNPAVIGIQKVLTQPIFIEVHRLSPFNPRGTDVSVVLDLMIHDLDIILYLVDSEVEHIDAVGVSVLTDTPDIANVRISFANGCVANVTASRVSAERMRKIRFFQNDAYISLDYVAQNAKIFKRQDWQIIDEEINFSGERPLQKEIQSFIQCITDGTRPEVSGEDGRNVLKAAEQIEKSIKEHLDRLKENHPAVSSTS